jgi:glycosyltransferase involved in cell wall biosynthesis
VGGNMSPIPRLSIGLPVYNGQNYLAEALDSLLAQTFSDFELIISDNASTDSTAQIAARYAATDARIRFFQQPANIGAALNHNFVFRQARAEFFKWASHDDLYAPTLLERCLELLDERPDAVLAHAFEAFIDAAGDVVGTVPYNLKTATSDAPVRFRSMLFDLGGDDMYGVMRSEELRRTRLFGSHHNSDRTLTTEIALRGPFVQVPEVLYFRRDHPDRAERARPTPQSRAANMDPRRGDRLRNPLPRLFVEYVWAYLRMIRSSPMSTGDRLRCLGYLAQWFGSRCLPKSTRHLQDSPDPAVRAKAGRRFIAGTGSGSGHP